MIATIRDLVEQALQEINAAQAGQASGPAVFAQGLLNLNMILDHFNAKDRALYADLFSVFNITPNLNPHPIGPGATWNYPIARPNTIPAASIILAGAPAPYIPLVPMTPQEWQGLSTPTLASSLPNRFFYNPTSPNGAFYFWTVASTAYQVQIQTRQLLVQVVANTAFAQPPGYWAALMMLLARKLSSPLRKPWKPEQQQELIEYVAAAFGNNGPDLLLETDVPSRSGPAGDFNYLTGNLTGR